MRYPKEVKIGLWIYRRNIVPVITSEGEQYVRYWCHDDWSLPGIRLFSAGWERLPTAEEALLVEVSKCLEIKRLDLMVRARELQETFTLRPARPQGLPSDLLRARQKDLMDRLQGQLTLRNLTTRLRKAQQVLLNWVPDHRVTGV
jgi:hypothetical protein